MAEEQKKPYWNPVPDEDIIRAKPQVRSIPIDLGVIPKYRDWQDLPTEIQLEIALKYYELVELNKDKPRGTRTNICKKLALEFGQKYGFTFTADQVFACVRRRKLKSLLRQEDQLQERVEKELFGQLKKIEANVEKKIQDKWLPVIKGKILDQAYEKLQLLLASLTPEKIARTKNVAVLVRSIEEITGVILELVGEPRRIGTMPGSTNTVIGQLNVWFDNLSPERKKEVEAKIEHNKRFTPFTLIENEKRDADSAN